MNASRIASALLCLLATLCVPAAAQDDVRPDESNLPEDHSPRGALWRAAAVPGWGQYYNRQYYKIPIVWVGLGGLAATAVYANHRYLLNRHAFHWIERDDVDYDVPSSYEDDYFTLIREMGLSPEAAAARQSELSIVFEQNRNNLRRSRDLLYIGVGLFYGLTILDAYVAAHLLEFDVGEDLTLSVEPIPTGLSATLQFGH